MQLSSSVSRCVLGFLGALWSAGPALQAVRREAPRLFRRVAEFHVAIGQFHSLRIQLESQRRAGIVGIQLRQRGLRGGVVVQHRQRGLPQAGSYLGGDQEIQQVVTRG